MWVGRLCLFFLIFSYFSRTFAATLFFPFVYLISCQDQTHHRDKRRNRIKHGGVRRVWEGIFDHGLNRRYILGLASLQREGDSFLVFCFSLRYKGKGFVFLWDAFTRVRDFSFLCHYVFRPLYLFVAFVEYTLVFLSRKIPFLSWRCFLLGGLAMFVWRGALLVLRSMFVFAPSFVNIYRWCNLKLDLLISILSPDHTRSLATATQSI